MSDPRPIGLVPGASSAGAGQDERKYSSTNPVVRKLLSRFFDVLGALVSAEEARPVLDVGVGEGLALDRLSIEGTVVGVEYRADKLAVATDHLAALHGVRADAGMLPFPRAAFGLVICTEVLEHLVRPDDAVRELARVGSRTCLVSVPWEPWFRVGNLARGKNIGRFGNDPEHVGAYSPRRLRRVLAAHFDDVEIHPCFPWLIAVGRRHSSETRVAPPS